MTRNNLWTLALVGGMLIGLGFGLTLAQTTPAAHAAPAPPAASASVAAPAGPLADMLAGKPYPLTLPAEKIDSSYHLIGLVDAQGKSSVYATRGDTIAAGGETFLVCYDVPLTKPQTIAPQPKAGTVGQVLFINLHVVQAMGGILPIAPPPDSTAPTARP